MAKPEDDEPVTPEAAAESRALTDARQEGFANDTDPNLQRERALHDQFVQQYTSDMVQPEPAPTAAPEPAGTGGVGPVPETPVAPAPANADKGFFRKMYDGELPGQDPSLNDKHGTMGRFGHPEDAKPEGGPKQVSDANAEAERRAEFNKLDPYKQIMADARLAQGSAAPRAMLISKGGMRPDTDTKQLTQGPEVSDADRLMHDIEYNATRSAGDSAGVAQERDTKLAGLQEQYTQGSNKLAAGEKTAQAHQSEALSQVAERMSKALEAAHTPVISPAQELASMNIGQKLAFVLASAGGGIAGRGTGENAFLSGYNQMIDSRIATQKREAEGNQNYAKGQDNLYGLMRQGFQSDDAARAGVRLMYYQALDSKMKEAAAHYNIDMANPGYMKMQAQISQQILQNQEELAKISGQHISEQKTERYAPPQVAMVGGAGIGKDEAAAREKINKLFTENKLYEQRDDLDTLNNIVRQKDKGGVVMKYIAAHPGMSFANAFFAARNDPTQKQLMVDIEREVKDSISGSGMRSELGRQLGQTLANPENALQAYNRLGLEYQQRAGDIVASVPGGYDVYQRMRRESQDIQDATNSPVRAIGAAELPKALPEPPENVRPAAQDAPGYSAATKKSHHKK